MNSASVDLIYLDPPFNSKANYAAPIGSQAAGAAFKDTWGLDDVNLAWHGEIKHEKPALYALLQATRQIHGDSMMSYLIYMSIRLMEMQRILKSSGSLYLHCDPTASHYLKLLLDCVFGRHQFINEVVWHYSSGGKSRRYFPKKHDLLLYYAKDNKKRIFNGEDVMVQRNKCPSCNTELSKWNNLKKYIDKDGRIYRTIKSAGKIYKYYDDDPVMPPDVWVEFSHLQQKDPERTGYPTQKPIALLERIIRASSLENGIVLDPFCGCATTCIAAEKLDRQWVGIDISPKATDLVRDRFNREIGMFFTGPHRRDIPKRTDLSKIQRYNHPANKSWLYDEQSGYCHGCKTHFDIRHLTIDHIIPRSKGGTDHISNLQLLCGHCNSVKGDRSHEYLLACLTNKGWVKEKKLAA